ncbi:MAG: hypothetical protein HRF50_10080 [Phycisphaerae bacterium]|jgi:hypothetical protein
MRPLSPAGVAAPESTANRGSGGRPRLWPARRAAPLRASCGCLLAAPLALAALAACGGCASQTELDLRRENDRLKAQLADTSRQLAEHQAAIDELNRQLQAARGFTDDDLKRIFYPEKLVIDSLSGGEDYDGKTGDDGVTVYLRPIDRVGDTVKVAGDIRIELYDLAAPADAKLLGEYNIGVDKASEFWYGKLMTNHYTIRCPWQKIVPANPEITVRATFRDFLTKRVITAQTVVTVKLPTSRPAAPGA